LAHGGSLIAKGPNGEREISAPDFFTGYLETALSPDELVTEIRIPKAAGVGWSYQKFNRRAQDWAIVGAAVMMSNEPKVALVNMGSAPFRHSGVEAALASGAGKGAAAVAGDDTDPREDLNADAEYRRHLARVVVGRGIAEAMS